MSTFIDICFGIFLLFALLTVYGIGIKKGMHMAYLKLAISETIVIERIEPLDEKCFIIHPGSKECRV